MTVIGHHHISMYTKDAQANHQFYTEVLGLRLVEKSVNQDDPSMYHLFYGDGIGAPGTLLTFFEMANLGKNHPGTNSIDKLVLLVPNEAALNFFKGRLKRFNVKAQSITYLGQPALSFHDPDGLNLILMVNDQTSIPHIWQSNPFTDIDAKFQILGMGPVELRLRNLRPTVDFLTETLGYTDQGNHDFTLNKDGYYTDIVLVEDSSSPVKPGRGYVHHIALSVKDDEDLEAIMHKIDQLPGSHSGIIDRYFFKSLYYRQNKILYEFATETPGFTVDTDVENLGDHLTLPDFLEIRRDEIESQLKEI